MTTIPYILLAILLLGILIAIHELGHFLTARLTGVPVVEYAIGMGPKILSHTGRKSRIRYTLRAIPMGGFCRFVGEDDPDAESHDDPRAFSKQKLWKRALTVLMGPGMNFILAFFALLLLFWVGGVNAPKEGTAYAPMISAVTAGGAAETAGIRPGDYILSVSGADAALPPEAFDDPAFKTEDEVLSARIRGWKFGDAPLEMVLKRGDETLTVQVSPLFDPSPEVGRNVIGISYGYAALEVEHRGLYFGESVRMAGESFGYYSTAIFNAVIGLFKGENLDQVSGIPRTVAAISEQVQAYGLTAFVELLALISVNLGIMNLLPIPGLDGSRLVFMAIEGVRGKPVPPEKEAVVHLVGMVLLFALMIVITVHDILSLVR